MTELPDGRPGPVILQPEDRDQPAGRVFALTLERLFDDFRRAEPAVVVSEDAEALHDYRVTIRRARSVLAAARRVLPAEELELLRALTATLADATSPVRDLDVLLEAFDDYCEPLSDELLDGAALLGDALRERRARARAGLVEVLRGDTHPVLVRRWQVMANVHRVGGSEPGPDALRPAGQVVDALIGRAYSRVVRLGPALVASDDRDDWHELRKRLKRLRYLITAFAPIYPDDAFEPLLDELPELQDRFGRLQDHVVHAELIEATGLEVGGRAALAAGALADALHHRVHDDIRRCRKRLRKVRSKPIRRSMGELLGTD